MPIKLNKFTETNADAEYNCINNNDKFILHIIAVGGRRNGQHGTSLYQDCNWNRRQDELWIKFTANHTRTVTKELSTLTVNNWMHIQISQELEPGKSIHEFKVEIDGEVVLAMENLQDSYFENVNVYAGHPNKQPQLGYIKDLFILEKPDKM